MKITEAFDVLKQHGHVIDQYEFDDQWLGKQRGHFAYLKSTDSQPSVDTLMRLHFRLISKDQAYKQYDLDTGVLSRVAESVMGEVERRCALHTYFPIHQSCQQEQYLPTDLEGKEDSRERG